jgi:hypothetical protein
MAAARTRLIGSVARTAVALLAGIACGALLVSAYIYSALGEPLVFAGLLKVSLFYGLAIAAFCVPLWLGLARLGWDRALPAAALGFVATGLFLGMTYMAGSHPGLHLMAYTFLPYAACGAVASLVTWWVDRLLRRT